MSRTRYGSFLHFDRMPSALFFIGEIEDNDSFEFRRALREHEITLIVAASPGGNLYEGLQIAAIVHDKALATYVPPDTACASACAFVFFGGTKRQIDGMLGVHQFYSGGATASDAAPRNVISTVTQYTTADIIGILNELETPPFVYERMFATSDIYVFDADETARLALAAGDAAFVRDRGLARTVMAEILASMPAPDTAVVPPVPEALPAIAPGGPEAASPSLPVADPDRFEIHFDTDLFGNDIFASGIKEVGLSDCQALCAGSPTCAAFSYVPATRWCWPKTGAGSMSHRQDAVSGIKASAGAPPSPAMSPFAEFTGKDLAGADLNASGVRGISLEQCRTICLDDASCQAYAWVRDERWCWPKSQAGQLIEKPGVMAGIRK